MGARQQQANAMVSNPQPQTQIGPGIRVNGRISGEEDLHIQGRVDGNIELTETLIVAPEGVVVAQVKARDVEIHGVLVGNVTAESSVTLHPGARLIGDLSAPRVIIADGAAYSGNVAMGEAPPRNRELERRTSRPKPRPTARASEAARQAPARGGTPARPQSSTGLSATSAANEVHGELRRVPPPSAPNPEPDDEVTVVVRHANLAPNAGEQDSDRKAPRARVPKPGKRRVLRR